MSSDSVESAVEYLTTVKGFNCKEVLGKGTYGSVIKVSSKERQKMAAKIVENNVVNLMEIQEWPRLDHLNVLRVADTFLGLDGVVIFVTDLMDTNLFQRLRSQQFRHGPASPDKCRLYARQVLSGIEYLHDVGFCHLDLRAENVLLAFDDRAVVADFSGMCRVGDMKKFCPLPTPLRPPEMLGTLKTRVRPVPIDLWSYGLLVTHLFLGKGFQECTTKHPKSGTLEACLEYMAYFQNQAYYEKFLYETYPNSPVSVSRIKQLMAFVHQFLQMDPKKRTGAEEGLKSGFLNAAFYSGKTSKSAGLPPSKDIKKHEPKAKTIRQKSKTLPPVVQEGEPKEQTTQNKQHKSKSFFRIRRIKIRNPFTFILKSDKTKPESKSEKKNKQPEKKKTLKFFWQSGSRH